MRSSATRPRDLRLPQPLQASVQPTATGWRWQATRPPGATRLEVGFRKVPAYRDFGNARAHQAAKARKAFEAANAGFDFTTVASLGKECPGKERSARSGLLRLVASGDGQLYVAVLKLEGPPR